MTGEPRIGDVVTGLDTSAGALDVCRLRLRYRDLATDWFDYLVCSPEEFAELVRGSAWQLTDVDDRDAPYYLATLRLTG